MKLSFVLLCVYEAIVCAVVCGGQELVSSLFMKLSFVLLYVYEAIVCSVVCL